MKIIEEQLRRKLTEAFSPDYLELENESYMHSVPAGSESHFRLILVSSAFKELGLVARQQKIYAVIADEMAGPVHAFSQRAYTPEEWEKVKDNHGMKSPDCEGGSAA